MRLLYNGQDKRIIEEGSEVLDWLENATADPYLLTSVPADIENYIQIGLQLSNKIFKDYLDK